MSDLVEHAISRAKEGDSHALHFLYVRFADEVRALVGGILHSPGDIDDVTQTVFAKLPREVRRYEPEEAPFPAWILRFAEKVARDRIGDGGELGMLEVGRNGADDGTGARQSWGLGEALRRLPEEQRRVLLLRHLGGLSPQDVARRLGLTAASVRGLDEHGRRKLRAAHRSPAGET